MSELVEKKDDCDCSISESYLLCDHFIDAFSIISKKWNGLIINSLCDTKKMRFKDLSRCICNCSDRVLTERLRELASIKIVKRNVDSESGIISYTLTQKGMDLKPVFDQVHKWADKWA